MIADHPNIYTDPSGTYCETGMLEHAVKMLGPDRILFGSDAPGADFVNNLAKVMCAGHQRHRQAKHSRHEREEAVGLGMNVIDVSAWIGGYPFRGIPNSSLDHLRRKMKPS